MGAETSIVKSEDAPTDNKSGEILYCGQFVPVERLGLLVMFSGLGFRFRVRSNFSGVADYLAAVIFSLWITVAMIEEEWRCRFGNVRC